MIHFNTDGTRIDFTAKKLHNVRLPDILLALSKENRFANTVDWTVLQHSLAVGQTIRMLYGNNVLLGKHGYCHDFQEAFIRDVPTPFKRMIGQGWWDAEEMIQSKLFEALGIAKLSVEDKRLLDEVDHTMAYVEALNLLPTDIADFMETQANYPPKTIAACTRAFMSVSSSDIFAAEDSDDLNHWVIHLYQTVLYSHTD